MGVFVAVDGPNGVGKSTAIVRAADLLRTRGHSVHQTKEPTTSRLGALAKELDGGMASETAYACLIAADRWEHAQAIEAAKAHHDIVLGDRYLPSSLVLNVARGVPHDFILALHRGILAPDLTLILHADAGVLRRRMDARGQGTTEGERLTRREDEARGYQGAIEVLEAIGHPAKFIDTSRLGIEQTAAAVADAVEEALACAK